MIFVSQEKAKELIKSSEGRFITVTFKKKNGEIRVLNGRTEVVVHTKGGANTVAHIEKYVKLWDVINKGYRNVNTETVTRVMMNGEVYVVGEEIK